MELIEIQYARYIIFVLRKNMEKLSSEALHNRIFLSRGNYLQFNSPKIQYSAKSHHKDMCIFKTKVVPRIPSFLIQIFHTTLIVILFYLIWFSTGSGSVDRLY